MSMQFLINNLSRYKPRSIQINSRFAAVAIIVYLSDEDSELFLIKRKVHPNDPWSGQIGLPGGHLETKDKDLIETAIRETCEETTIMLTRDHLICQIDDQQGYAKGGQIDLTVRPFVFVVDQKPAAIQINYELERAYWLSANHFQQPENHIYFDPMNTAQLRPGVQIDQANVLWGMTYRILTDFFTAMDHESIFINDRHISNR